jgi:hypothetical protein
VCGPTSDEFEDLLFYDPKRVSDVRWNFEVFLINRNGFPLYRYSPDTPISDIEADIKILVNPPRPIVERLTYFVCCLLNLWLLNSGGIKNWLYKFCRNLFRALIIRQLLV